VSLSANFQGMISYGTLCVACSTAPAALQSCTIEDEWGLGKVDGLMMRCMEQGELCRSLSNSQVPPRATFVQLCTLSPFFAFRALCPCETWGYSSAQKWGGFHWLGSSARTDMLVCVSTSTYVKHGDCIL
jgi:hypothetical protein